MAAIKNKIYLTFDLEEWPSLCHHKVDKSYDRSVIYSQEGCLNLIGLLDKYGVRCTFFTTGYFAEVCPEMVRLLADKGHEIASHAFYNRDLTVYSAEEIAEQIKKSKGILINLSQKPVLGFRAPCFSIDTRVFKIIEAEGFKYDSSVHPAVVPGYYYNFADQLSPYKLGCQNNENMEGIWEIPVSVIPGIRFPVSWWWMRNLGTWITILGSKINLIQKRSVVLYFHPWEFAELPVIKGIPGHITRTCGKKNLKRLEKVITVFRKNYQFERLEDFLTDKDVEGILK